MTDATTPIEAATSNLEAETAETAGQIRLLMDDTQERLDEARAAEASSAFAVEAARARHALGATDDTRADLSRARTLANDAAENRADLEAALRRLGGCVGNGHRTSLAHARISYAHEDLPSLRPGHPAADAPVGA